MKSLHNFLVNNRVNNASDEEGLLCEAIEWLKSQTKLNGNSGMQDKDIWDAFTNKIITAFDLDKEFNISVNTIYTMFDVDVKHPKWDAYIRYLNGTSDSALITISYIPNLSAQYMIWDDEIPKKEKGNEFLNIMSSSADGDTCVKKLFGKQAHSFNPHNTGVTGYYVNYTKFKK